MAQTRAKTKAAARKTTVAAVRQAAAETKAILETGERQKPGALKHLEELDAAIRVCRRCPLQGTRTLAVPGEGKATAKVIIIGEAPGRNEDLTGRPFVGSSGKYLDQVLKGTGFTRADFFITNIVKCRPPKNRVPKTNEIETCTSLYLFNQIALINPRLIMLLGGVAVKKMLGLATVEEARGRIIEHEGRKFLATYHPAVRFYREDLAKKIGEDFALLKEEMAKW